MKKIVLFYLLILIVGLSGCSSKDKEEFPGVGENELAFIAFDLKITPLTKPYDNKFTDRYVYLFKLDGAHPSEKIYPFAMDFHGERVCTIDDVNNELIVSDYSGKFSQVKDDAGYYTLKGKHSIFNNNIITGLTKGNYLVVIETCGSYFCSKMKFNDEKYGYYTLNLIQTANVDGYQNKCIWF